MGPDMKKHVRINFVDFWKGFDPTDNMITRRLAPFYELEFCDDPDFLFVSAFGHEHLKHRGVKILYMGENLVPDFNLFDYALGFDRLSFGDRYIRYPNYCFRFASLQSRLKGFVGEPVETRDFCNVVISNGHADECRGRMFELLNAYRPVKSGGRWRNNIGGRVSDKLAFEGGFKFTLAFENTAAPGYVTEKILEAFAGGTVPIYWGAPDVTKDFNPDAFFNCNDYATLEEAVEGIKALDADDAAYARMLAAPVFREDSEGLALMRDDPLVGFLRHILDQSPAAARRRNDMGCAGKCYREDLRFQTAVEDFMSRRCRHLKQILKRRVVKGRWT